MLRLAASRGGGPETRSGTVQSLKCCPCQQKRAARLPSAAPGSIKAGGPETRSGTVQSLKCCPCQQKRAAQVLRLAGPRNALGHRPEPEVLPLLPSAAPGSIKGGGPETRAEPEVLPLPAETSREAPKCCAWQHQGKAPETRSGTVQSLKCCPCQQKRAARLPSAAPGRSLKCCPCQQKRAARLSSVCLV